MIQEKTVDSDGNIYPDWKSLLDEEYTNLNNVVKEVNVVDFGAIGNGKTDNTLSFKKAIGTGRVKVVVPEGVFITKEIRMPSWTILVGAGKGVTIIKLHDSAKKGTRLITNTNHESLERKPSSVRRCPKFGLECREAGRCCENRYVGKSFDLLNVCKCDLWLGKGC
jgi:hypothetical protein